MLPEISRKSTKVTATVLNGAALSAAIDYRAAAGGTLKTPATLNATTVIGFKVASQVDGTYVPLKDKNNALVQLTVQLDGANAIPLPDELFGAAFFKIWTCTTAGVDVAQTGDKAFTVMMKG